MTAPVGPSSRPRSFAASLWSRFFKRAVDIVASALLLCLLWPLMLLVAALVALFLGRPVLFRQQRPGLRGRPFTIVKFRSMRTGSGSDGQRLTRFGKMLRSTSLDELPELWNVLKGEMSLVGPRPLLMEYLDRYSPEQARRHEVRPGITGWAQVNGRNAVGWPERLAMDTWYVDNLGPVLDAKIMLITLKRIVMRQGIAQPGQVSCEPFSGTECKEKREDV